MRCNWYHAGTFLPPIAALALAACATLAPRPDAEAAALADAVRSGSGAFYARLAATPAPECDYEHNMSEYTRMQENAGRLQAHLAQAQAGPALASAAQALARTITDARHSHELASARSDDPNGMCMAPGSIALNAGAIERASLAIAAASLAGAATRQSAGGPQ